MNRLVTSAMWAALCLATSTQASSHELYDNVIPADTAGCLEKVKALPLATYEIKHDSVKGRRHLGPVGSGLEEAIPESVEVRARNTYPSPKKGGAPIVLENQAIIDKTVIFMNNVAATQELAARNQAMWEKLREQIEFHTRMNMAISSMEERLEEEESSQLLERMRTTEAEAEEAHLATKLEIVKTEEAQKNIEMELDLGRQAAEHKLQIARRRLAAEAEGERAIKSEAQRMEEESTRRKEALRLETETGVRRRRMELERELDTERLEMDRNRVKAEVQAKVAAEQQNEDVLLRKIRAQGEEDRRRTQEAINTVLTHLASAAVGLMSDPRRASMLTCWLLGLVAGYLILREATSLLRQLVEAYLGKPGLIRETSRVGALASTVDALRCRVKKVASYLHGIGSGNSTKGSQENRGRSAREESVRTFQDVVLPPDLKEQVVSLAMATKNAKRNGAPYRHLLLYGPPGTGKTMVAKRLAACSGMDCAIMSGGDVGPLGKDAVTELHGLFRWAAKSQSGLLLFIDEAEAFLGKRSSPSMSEDTRNALNALLYNTGSASHRLMMVLATNRAEDLDDAVLDRMDDSLLFPIPDKKSRAQLLVQYFNKYCAAGFSSRKDSGPSGKRGGILSKLLVWRRRETGGGVVLGAGVDDRLIKGLADEVQGFSGREVAKLMLAVQSCAHGSEEGILTPDMVKRVVSQKAREHGTKESMRAASRV